MAQNRGGPPVRGEDCFGRKAFVSLVSEKLKGGHVLLASPRRFGKTSVMYRLIDQPEWAYQVIHLDLEHFSEPSELVSHLVEALARDDRLAKVMNGVTWLPRQLWKGFRENIDEVELFEMKVKLKEQIRQGWQDRGEDILQRVAATGVTVIFILDEFPMMIDRMGRDKKRAEAKTLLHWLRALRQDAKTSNLRFLIAGSIGIDQVLNELGEIASINDFERLQLEPFSSKVASEFLDVLAVSHELPLSPASKRKMLALIGTHVPYFLQILFSEIAKAWMQHGVTPTPKEIDRIYREKVLGVDCKTYFDHYYGRLRDYYRPDEEKAAKRILRELAVVGPIARDAIYQFFKGEIGTRANVERFSHLMTNLENDFYIRFDAVGGRYEFSCKLLRDWWLRHYGLDFEG